MTTLTRCGCCGDSKRTLGKHCRRCQRDLDDTARQWARDHGQREAA